MKVAPKMQPSSLIQNISSMVTGDVQNSLKRPAYEISSPGASSTTSSSSSSSQSTDSTDNKDLQIHSNMYKEEDRLKTYENWPLDFLSPQRLAKTGFYYLGHDDEVRCPFCKVEIMRWREGDDPEMDHKRWAPQCPFLKNKAGSGNVPLETDASSGRDECGVRAPPSTSVTPPPRIPSPAHPRYATAAARLQTFKDWPRSLRQKPEDLVEAGFFYTGQSDKTKCYYCDGGLKDWESDDIPWEQHARWFDRCPYVQLVKGRAYVQRVITEAYAIKEVKEDKTPAPDVAVTKEAEKDEEKSDIKDDNLCKICYDAERNICFVPCGHVVACAKCALSTQCKQCPMCRRTFTDAVRIYFS